MNPKNLKKALFLNKTFQVLNEILLKVQSKHLVEFFYKQLKI